MASSAIPVLFPSIKVTEPESAAGWYVDGATRRRVPLAPALELGADRVVIVGTGSLRPADPDPEQDQTAVDLGDGGATLLGAVMDDPLRHDLRMLHVGQRPRRQRRGRRPPQPAPGRDRAPAVPGHPVRGHRAPHRRRARRHRHGGLPGQPRHGCAPPLDPDLQLVHRLLGSDSPLQGELLSYLLFDPDFFTEAAALGAPGRASSG